jgi:hypothetical protein
MFASAPVGAVLGSKFGWMGVLIGLPAGLLAGLILVAVSWFVWTAYGAFIGYVSDCCCSIDEGLRPNWLRLRGPVADQWGRFPLWSVPLLGGLCAIPFGVGMWIWMAAFAFLLDRQLPSFLHAISLTVNLVVLVTTMLTVVGGCCLWLWTRPRIRAWYSRFSQLVDDPRRRPFLLLPLTFTVVTIPVAVAALAFSRAVDFFLRPDRFTRWTLQGDGLILAFLLVLMFLIGCGVEWQARRR